MKLYVMMPVINCLELTQDAIKSIGSECTVIVVDNKSDDGTQAWGETLLTEPSDKPFPLNNNVHGFHYIRNEERKSVSQSWNQGVKLALEDPECQYIAILNNDVVIHPKTLDHLMKFMDKTGYLMVTADNIKDRMSIQTMQQMELPMPFTDYDCWPINEWRAEGPDFSCFMISPDTIRVIGWFDEHFVGGYCEDQDYHARINRAYRHAKEHNDQGLDPERIHAKRLSTAPYFHYASQTMTRNIPLRKDIAVQHGKNQNYYLQKWGGEHPAVMDGAGNVQPFGDATKNWRDW
jgi:glycosyltransferase involved in cell wall biosynthesis